MSRASTPVANPTAQSSSENGAAAAAERVEQAVRRDHGEPAQPPQHLLDPEVVDGLVEAGALEPSAYGGGAAEDPLDRVGRRAEQRPEHPGRRGRPETTPARPARAPAQPRHVAHVGQDAQRRASGGGWPAPARATSSSPSPATAPSSMPATTRAHDRIRRSVGSRPIRIISR